MFGSYKIHFYDEGDNSFIYSYRFPLNLFLRGKRSGKMSKGGWYPEYRDTETGAILDGSFISQAQGIYKEKFIRQDFLKNVEIETEAKLQKTIARLEKLRSGVKNNLGASNATVEEILNLKSHD
jgi:hypothetical protein